MRLPTATEPSALLSLYGIVDWIVNNTSKRQVLFSNAKLYNIFTSVKCFYIKFCFKTVKFN